MRKKIAFFIGFCVLLSVFFGCADPSSPNNQGAQKPYHDAFNTWVNDTSPNGAKALGVALATNNLSTNDNALAWNLFQNAKNAYPLLFSGITECSILSVISSSYSYHATFADDYSNQPKIMLQIGFAYDGTNFILNSSGSGVSISSIIYTNQSVPIGEMYTKQNAPLF